MRFIKNKRGNKFHHLSMNFGNKKGQVTIFIIIAIVIVASTIIYLFARDTISEVAISPTLEPAYKNFLSCLEEDTMLGVKLIESQAGYIDLPEFIPGSSYMPFSSQLDFLGNAVPYWYYVGGNNIAQEQVPKKSLMEEQLEEFVSSRIETCDFDSYYEQGYEISFDNARSKISIHDESIDVVMNLDLSIARSGETITISKHKINVKSYLGGLYDTAKEIYEKEQNELFLEKYAVDNLRLYAPVDGVELSCSPLTWNADEVFSELSEAIEINTMALKVEGGDYTLNVPENKYFILDNFNPDYGVRFLNSRNWAHSFEVSPSEGNILIAEPVGNQKGLGILGFCYVPYHFVYNVNYPVLVQVYEGDEVFQFPVAVVVQANKEREALKSGTSFIEENEVCKYLDTPTNVKAYELDSNSNLNLIEAQISYSCLGATCDVEEISEGNYLFPQCVNGYVLAKADGYLESRYLYSSVDEGSVEIILDKLYEVEINLQVGGKSSNREAMISFVSENLVKNIFYPETKVISLAQGNYDIQVQVYKNSSIEFGATTQKQCSEVPRGGIGGLIGLTEEQCFDIEIPEQIISNVLAGGGSTTTYFGEFELSTSSSIVIDAPSLPTPRSLDQLQTNYLLFEEKELSVYLRQ